MVGNNHIGFSSRGVNVCQRGRLEERRLGDQGDGSREQLTHSVIESRGKRFKD